MSMPDPRLGRVETETQATANAIQSLGNIQNAINQSVGNQLNIIHGYAQRKASREAQDKEILTTKEINKENIQAQRNITNLNNQASFNRQKDAQNFQINKVPLKLAQATGDSSILKHRFVGGVKTFKHNIGDNQVLILNNNHWLMKPDTKTVQTINDWQNKDKENKK